MSVVGWARLRAIPPPGLAEMPSCARRHHMLYQSDDRCGEAAWRLLSSTQRRRRRRLTPHSVGGPARQASFGGEGCPAPPMARRERRHPCIASERAVQASGSFTARWRVAAKFVIVRTF